MIGLTRRVVDFQSVDEFPSLAGSTIAVAAGPCGTCGQMAGMVAFRWH